jgi:glycosyltransferase involved in cell wall biosynthesis
MACFKILVATDAWRPQINGVVRTLEALAAQAPHHGAAISFLTPEGFPSLPMPTYPDIRLAWAGRRAIAERIEAARPHAIHIATEGPIGYAVRAYCQRHQLPFTTCYHTRYPDYVAARWPVPLAFSYAVLRHFHNAGHGTMAATPALADELRRHGFKQVLPWQRGIDVAAFGSGRRILFETLPRPLFLCVARVSVEKNIEAFLRLPLPGSKVVVGDGPARPHFEKAYPDVHFTGFLAGQSLYDAYASADVFVFPSLTDTYGLVVLEALAAGLPVAAFPVSGPRDILAGSFCGVLDQDLARAALTALSIPSDRCRAFAARHTLSASFESFLANIKQAQAAGRKAIMRDGSRRADWFAWPDTNS